MKSFDEGFDNILTFDYDADYQMSRQFLGEDLIETSGRKSICLDGMWNFSPDLFESVIRSRWFDEVKYNREGMPIPYDFDFDHWEEIRVPGSWNIERPEYRLYEGAGLYSKKFSYIKVPNKKVYLRIGGANYETRIWLNKTYIGRHMGGFTPFMVDITDYLEVDNRILIFVNNERKVEQIPSLHYDWFNYGGIHRSVELYEVPKKFIKKFTIKLNKLSDKDDFSKLEYSIWLDGVDNKLASGQSVTITIPELNVKEEILISNDKLEACDSFSQNQNRKVSGTLTLNHKLELWTPDTPKLYELVLSYGEDCIREQIGFRTIHKEGSDIYLNGEKIFLKGLCVHEESMNNGRAVSKEEIKQTIMDAKELGCNFLRLTHYPHNEEMARLADALGILLWEEIPVYWALEFDNPNTLDDAKNQLSELITRDRNRASVIIWSIGNENPDSDSRYEFMSELAEVARSLDETRLIAASCLIDVEECVIKDRLIEKLDVIGINEYYGWYLRDFSTLEKILKNSQIGKPIIITETGADAVPCKYSEEHEFYSEEYQADVYKKQFELLLQFDYIRGVTPWILYDYASMRRMNLMQRGYNLKGIISKDRSHKKKAYYVLKEIYDKL